MKLNPINLIDFYKSGHIYQYPEKTEVVYSNFTPRSSRLARMSKLYDDRVVFVGLQGVIKWLLIDLWNKQFFRKDKEKVLAAYKRRMDLGLGPNVVTTEHVAALHDLGYLPIEIKALEEGSRVNIRVPVFTIRNTLPEFAWLTNYLETQLSAESWKAITAATIAYDFRAVLEHYAKETGSPQEFVSWQGHDFSMRGMSGVHDAAQTGFGHLCSFYGTDTVPALDYAEEYYAGDKVPVLGGSVPATEHSVMCLGGKDDEVETFRRIIKSYPTGVVSIVSDTWNFWNVVSKTALALKDEILNRKPNELGLAKVVFRPDSGDPVKIVAGYALAEFESVEAASEYVVQLMEPGEELEAVKIDSKYYEIDFTYDLYEGDINGIELGKELTPEEANGAIWCLWEVFGGSITETGHRLLNERVGLIYGDSITIDRAQAILARLDKKAFASANIVFGIGSFSYQYVSRDTFGHAMKATYAVVYGEGRELEKSPVTDSGTKKSARGLLRVEKDKEGNFILLDQQTEEEEAKGLLQTVFRDGKLVKKTSLKKIRRKLHGKKL